jgi:hypothetical protein
MDHGKFLWKLHLRLTLTLCRFCADVQERYQQGGQELQALLYCTQSKRTMVQLKERSLNGGARRTSWHDAPGKHHTRCVREKKGLL